MINPFKSKTIAKFKQARGLLDKVIKMTEEDEYCMDIIQQSLAVQGFMKSADQYILESHLNTCAGDAMKKGGKAQKKIIEEIVKVCAMAKR